jgi:hypothetical protein
MYCQATHRSSAYFRIAFEVSSVPLSEVTAAGHIRESHDMRLKAAGAHYMARSFAEAELIARSLIGW